MHKIEINQHSCKNQSLQNCKRSCKRNPQLFAKSYVQKHLLQKKCKKISLRFELYIRYLIYAKTQTWFCFLLRTYQYTEEIKSCFIQLDEDYRTNSVGVDAYIQNS